MSEQHVSTEHGDDQKHKPACGGWGMLVLGVLVGAAFGWVFYPNIVMSSKTQPINFSHKAHGEGAGLTCDTCHGFREDGSFSGIPKLEKCAECHESAQTDSPEEAKLIERYIQPKKEIPWLSYAFQPGCVFFSHSAHINMAKLDCAQCHDDKTNSTDTPPVRQFILSGYSQKTMSMEACEDCHAKHHSSNACFVCHK